MTISWEASMIAADADFDGAPLLRKEFELEAGHGRVSSAVLHGTSFGIFEATVNGTPVGPEVFTPGWSSYEWRLRYYSFDVSDLLAAKTVIGVLLVERRRSEGTLRLGP